VSALDALRWSLGFVARATTEECVQPYLNLGIDSVSR